ncbi:MAG: alginate O-acetyltransferase complex protein AlgJ [Granulosicoccus sp.]|jgi:alginate O-acetyltransferase complex protein AlgJ
MTRIISSISVFVALALSLAGGLFYGFYPEQETEGPLLISLSFICEELQSELEVSYLDSSMQVSSGNQKSVHPSFNSGTFEFPNEPTLDSLTFKISASAPVHITGLSINSGAFHRTYQPKELISVANIYSDHFLIDQMNQLVIVPENGIIKLVFKDQLSFETEAEPDLLLLEQWVEDIVISVFPSGGFDSEDLNWNWVWTVFWVLLGIQLAVLFVSKSDEYLKAQLIALVLASLASFILQLMVEDVKNASITLSLGEQSKNDSASYQLYYSLNGEVIRDHFVSEKAAPTNPVSVSISLPNSVHRHLRLDLPVNDSLIISSIRFQYWPLSFDLIGYEIIENFSGLNDLNYLVNENGDLVVKTGSFDPFMSFSKDEFQDQFVTYQLKKEHYPFLIFFALYLIYLGVLLVLKRRSHALFLLAFLSILMLPNISFLFKETVVTLNTEKREAARLPVAWDNVRDLTRKTSEYLDDQFGGRASLITGWNILNVMLFGQTGNGAAVVFGKDNWMYYQSEEVTELFENTTPLSEEEMEKMTDILEERRKWLAAYGIDYYVVVPPLKHTVYEENLPSHLRMRAPVSKLDMFSQYIKSNSSLNYLDLKDQILAAKAKEELPIYFKYDSHWNMTGAFYGYSEIIEHVKVNHPEVGASMKQSDFTWEMEYSTEGDLAKMISMNEYFVRSELMPLPNSRYKAEVVKSIDYPSLAGRRPAYTLEVQDTTLPTLLVDRDSYSNYLIPYLSNHFERSVYVWSPLFSAEIIKTERPDIVITQMTERSFLDVKLENPELVVSELDSINQLVPETEIVRP